jgi:hypothetical protein
VSSWIFFSDFQPLPPRQCVEGRFEEIPRSANMSRRRGSGMASVDEMKSRWVYSEIEGGDRRAGTWQLHFVRWLHQKRVVMKAAPAEATFAVWVPDE